MLSLAFSSDAFNTSLRIGFTSMTKLRSLKTGNSQWGLHFFRNFSVMRRRPKASKPYQYFCVFTTDLTLEIPQILEYYRQRWQIETAFRDAKQNFGFDTYRLKSRKSINRFVELSFVAASLTKLVFTMCDATQKQISVEKVCEHLNIHWYRPEKLTQGNLRVAYLRSQIAISTFSAKFKEKTNSQNINGSVQDDTAPPFDKAA